MMSHTADQTPDCFGYRFQRRELLLEALTHPSWPAENGPAEPDNQRLEFLGDAVLQLLVTAMLYERFPDEPEGHLTRLRSALTKEPALVRYATALGLGDLLRLGRGEEQTGGRQRPSNLGDAFEAVVGALYLDGGIAAAAAFVSRLTADLLDDVDGLLSEENPKGALQELTQERFGSVPRYETVAVSGPEHEPLFEVAVFFRQSELGRAVSGSRRDAERQAAKVALRVLKEAGHAE